MENKNEEHYISELKRHGLKATKTRLAVLRYLDDSDRPLTPSELLLGLRSSTAHKTSVDLVSIYRILDAFSRSELVHQVQPNEGYVLCRHSSCEEGLHILSYCQNCRSAAEMEIPFEILGPLTWYLRQHSQFEARDHCFQIAGLCGRCVVLPQFDARQASLEEPVL